jgi:hypothetical protein
LTCWHTALGASHNGREGVGFKFRTSPGNKNTQMRHFFFFFLRLLHGCSTRARDADDLSSRVVYRHLAFDQSAGTPISWKFKTCHCPVASSHDSNVQWQQVASSHDSNVQWQQVAPVTSSGNRCLLVAVRSHFGLRLDGRINPDRASNRILGRRIRIRVKKSSNEKGQLSRNIIRRHYPALIHNF